MWWSGSITPHILILCTWRWAVNLTSRPLHPRWGYAPPPESVGLGGCVVYRANRAAVESNLLHQPGIEPILPSCSTRSLATFHTALFRFPSFKIRFPRRNICYFSVISLYMCHDFRFSYRNCFDHLENILWRMGVTKPPDHPAPAWGILGTNIFLPGSILQDLAQDRPLFLGKQTSRGRVPRSREYTAKLCHVSRAALGTNTHVQTFPQREIVIEGSGETDGC